MPNDLGQFLRVERCALGGQGGHRC
jgi:hypothetical protein